MSTVKIKTEPTAATTAAIVDDVQVKLEPSFSTADIKLEQHSSDIDTKVESDSEVDSEEDDIKSENDDDDDDDDDEATDQATEAPKTQRRFICEYLGCERRFKTTNQLRMHQNEHRLQAELNIFGKTFTLTRQSLDDRWSCPILDCTSTAKTIYSLSVHMRSYHATTMGQRHYLRQHPSQKTKRNLYFLGVDDIYVNGVRCGYHNTIGVFICYECRLVPECLLTHLQQKHGFDEKLVDTSALPDSAVTANADPNTNQHTRNPHLASAISQPYQQHQQDIVQGWLCVTSDCGYCNCAIQATNDHKKQVHRTEKVWTVPALVLRLSCTKTHTSFFLITRIDQAGGAVTTSSKIVNQHKLNSNHNGLNTQDENGDDVEQNDATEASNRNRRYICEYLDCGCVFNSAGQLSSHRREHKLEVMIGVYGKTFTLSRQSSDDRWACPISGCGKTYQTVTTISKHINKAHGALIKQKRANVENEDSKQQQQPVIKRRHPNFVYLNVDDFYVSGARCGYHTANEMFICHKCRLVPECLLTHLQQKHEYDEKLIDNSSLPESAVNASADPNGNQHTSNQHLASAISQPYQWHHPDILRGWLCVTSNCGYCGYTSSIKINHKGANHQGKQISTVPALVLRLYFAKTQTMYALIARLDMSTSSIEPGNSMSQYNNECDDDDGDELVLSDMGDDDDVH